MKTPEEKIEFIAQAEAMGSGLTMWGGFVMLVVGLYHNDPALALGGIAILSGGAGVGLKSWHDFELFHAIREAEPDLSTSENLQDFIRSRRNTKYADLDRENTS